MTTTPLTLSLSVSADPALVDVVRSTAVSALGRFDASVAWEIGTAVSEATSELFRLEPGDPGGVASPVPHDATIDIRIDDDAQVRVMRTGIASPWPPDGWRESLPGVILGRLTETLDVGVDSGEATGGDGAQPGGRAVFVEFTVSGGPSRTRP